MPENSENGTNSHLWYRPVLLLSVCWALAFSVLTACAASLNLAGREISSDAAIATLPMAMQSYCTGIYNLVLPFEFERLGRWQAYMLGGVIGISGCICCIIALEAQSMLLLCAGSAQIGIALAHSQNFRFGVGLCVEPARVPVAISWVLAGGVVGAVIGPGFSAPARDMLPTPFTGIFLVSAVCWLLLVLLLLTGRRYLHGLTRHPPKCASDVDEAEKAPRRPLWSVFAQPRCWACTLIASAAYGIMVFYMAAVPLQMRATGLSFAQSSLAIQVHMVLMFAPSFVTGHAVNRLGSQCLTASGALLIALGGAIAWADTAQTMLGFTLSQALIGLGWNLCFVPATAGLAKQTRPSETARVQAANDVIVFLTSGSCMLVAGPALSGLGWLAMQPISFGTSGAILLALLVSEGLEAAHGKSRGARTAPEPQAKSVIN